MTATSALDRVFSAENCIHPRSVFVRLTSRCNQRCNFCNIRGGEPIELAGAQAAAMIDAALGADEDAVIHLTGGEPTLRTDLFDLASRVRDAGGDSVVLQTNAMRLADMAFAERLVEAGVSDLIVSLHAPIAERSDALTARPGSFDLTLRGLTNALAAGLGIWTNIVFTVANLEDGPATARTVARLLPGVRGIILSTAQPHGLARQNGAAIVPKLSDAARAIRRTIETCEEIGMAFHLSQCENPLCFVLAATGQEVASVALATRLRQRLKQNGCVGCRLAAEMAVDKTKPKTCSRCALTDLCGGVWAAQIEIHGPAEVTPCSALVADLPRPGEASG